MARQWAAEALCFAFLVKSLQFLLVRKQSVRYNKLVCFLSEELRMSRMETESGRSDRIELRATPHEKALLARAAAIEHLDLTSFVMRAAMPGAREVVERTEQIELSERDTLRVLALLENPPPPNAKLTAAAKACAANQKQLVNK